MYYTKPLNKGLGRVLPKIKGIITMDTRIIILKLINHYLNLIQQIKDDEEIKKLNYFIETLTMIIIMEQEI